MESIVNTASGKLILRKKAHEESINIVKCLSESLVATGCDEGVVKIWDIRTRKSVAKYASTDYVSDILYVHEKHTLISTSGDGSLGIFDIRKQKATFSEQQDGMI